MRHLCLSLPLARSLPWKRASPIRFPVVTPCVGSQGERPSQCFLSSFSCHFTISSSNLRCSLTRLQHYINICHYSLMVSFSIHWPLIFNQQSIRDGCSAVGVKQVVCLIRFVRLKMSQNSFTS